MYVHTYIYTYTYIYMNSLSLPPESLIRTESATNGSCESFVGLNLHDVCNQVNAF